jgi:hypothetical protein
VFANHAEQIAEASEDYVKKTMARRNMALAAD